MPKTMTFEVDVLPSTTSTLNLGSSDKKWKVNGVVPGDAIDKNVDSSISSESSTNIPTSAAVASFVNGKIDDTAGDGDTDKTWSADKLVDEFAAKSDQMVVLTYGTSTWNDFINAYNKNNIVYCRVSTSGSNGQRLAFLAYVNRAVPTEVEFQYYRSVNGHSQNQQGDETYVYKLKSDGSWTTTVRQNYTKIAAGSNLTGTYSSETLTLDVDVATTTETQAIISEYGVSA